MEIALLDCTGHAFAKHSHDDFVIGANLAGRERIWLDGRSLEAQTSEVTLYNPGQVQAGDARGQPWRFVSLYVQPGLAWRLTGWPGETFFERPLLRDEPLAARVREIGANALAHGFPEGEIVEAVATLLGSLPIAPRGAVGRVHDRGRSLAGRIAARLRDRMEDPPSLGDLAAGEGLSPVQLVRAFTRAYGLPPFAWLNGERVKEARRLLLANRPVAAVAAELGFADQAHLTRRFKAAYGVPPGAYRRG